MMFDEYLFTKKSINKISGYRYTTGDPGTSGLTKQISKEFNISKKYIYDMILKIKKGNTPV